MKVTFLPVTLYKCTNCGNIYETIPEECSCMRTKSYRPGNKVGSFVVRNITSNRTIFETKCILCGNLCKIAISNIRKQKSCGCKPRYIEIINVEEHQVLYHCRRCQTDRLVVPPIVSYCCSDKSEIEELGD